ncbi:hypothetical protein FACS189487_06160 [Campylobacterota bacterium]|nr:hypothetical protein FACS189487_06160 [Campylobacterota bacterium]
MFNLRSVKDFCAKLALGAFVLWALVAILQLWTEFLSSSIFAKISVTAGIVVVVGVIVMAVLRDAVSDAELERDGYIG